MDDWRERTRLACGFGRRARTVGGTIQFGKRFSARRRKRQPGRSRSPAKSQPCGQWQFGVDEWGGMTLNLENVKGPMIAKCSCQHCDGGIEFDASELAEENSIVPCPHCGMETKLFVDTAGLFSIAQDKSKSFEERKAAFRAYSEATKSKREADLRECEEHIKKYETTAKIHSLKDELELAGDKIIIRRRGVLNALTAGINGERTILISSLTAIQMKPGGLFSAGYIVFSYAGSKPYAGGMFAATEDPDAFFFAQDLNEQVASFKSKVERIMRDSKQAPSSSNPKGTLTDELSKLAELKQQGILSQAEFEAAKKKLLT